MPAATSNHCKNCCGLAPLFAALLAGCATSGPDLPPVPVGGMTNTRMTYDRMVEAPPPVRHSSIPEVVIQAASPDDVLRLQVMLDRANFSPGCIDGRMGPQTRGALRAWQRREGLAETGELDAALLARLPATDEIFTTHVVHCDEEQSLRLSPVAWEERAALDHQGYATILELVAEKYHSTQRAIREWNPAVPWPNPPVGMMIRVPSVNPAARAKAARVEIHLAGKYLQVFDARQQLIAHFPCSIARDVEKRPVGELRIVNAAENPNYTFDPALFTEDPAAAAIGRRLIIPPGPNNPVGVAWLSLDRPGYGIHGTPAPEDIGKTESHGCFRLANWNARKLLGMISIGLPVLVYE